MFKEFSGNETLWEHGFQVLNDDYIKHIVLDFNRDLEEVAKGVNHTDVFRTKLGDIKQIQNLDFGFLNKRLVELIHDGDFIKLNNQYFCKPPHYKETSAHQDNAYFESDSNVVTFWIPLVDVNIFNGCMLYVPESHTHGLVDHHPIGTNVRTRTGKKGVSLYANTYKNDDYVSVPMKAGQILVHDKNTMHFSTPNITDEYRIALTLIAKLT